MARILVVEDQSTLRSGILRYFGGTGHRAEGAEDAEKAMRMLEENEFDVVITDLKLPGKTGMDVLRKAKSMSPSTQVILMTAFGSVENAIEAMKLGAADYLQKPFQIPELKLRVEKALALEREEKGETPEEKGPLPGIIGRGPAMREVLKIVRKAAPSEATVLITGETGTGKEMVAEAIHALSPRSALPFIKVNCAAIPENLLESELFGHEKGAFTGAVRQRMGRFEQAARGTIFLDEIGDMAPFTQAKILRVLQEKAFERVGGDRTISADVRVLAATNRDLAEEVREGRFREDLFFRLDVIRVHLPPLRERLEDIEPLAEHFLAGLAKKSGGKPRELSGGARRLLGEHSWPGNVRELENCLERSVLLSDKPALDVPDLQLSFRPRRGEAPPGEPPATRLKALERKAVLEALEKAHFVQAEAARILGVSRRVIHYKVRQMGITHPRWERKRRK